VQREIVGVVADVPTVALDGAAEPSVYLPFEQAVTGDFAVIARTDMVPDALTTPLRRAVAAENPQLPIAEVHTLDALVAGSLKPRRFVLALFGCFSLAALGLAMVGVYGVNNQATLERARELGVRMALGAEPAAVVGLVMVQGVVPALGGLTAGLVGAALFTRVIRSLLFGVGAIDIATFAGATLLVLTVAALACYLPARRAARADLVATLRSG
jgi:ABC-type antimicrobial peptide transport system permease subunit